MQRLYENIRFISPKNSFRFVLLDPSLMEKGVQFI